MLFLLRKLRGNRSFFARFCRRILQSTGSVARCCGRSRALLCVTAARTRLADHADAIGFRRDVFVVPDLGGLRRFLLLFPSASRGRGQRVLLLLGGRLSLSGLPRLT